MDLLKIFYPKKNYGNNIRIVSSFYSNIQYPKSSLGPYSGNIKYCIKNAEINNVIMIHSMLKNPTLAHLQEMPSAARLFLHLNEFLLHCCVLYIFSLTLMYLKG